MNDQKKTKEELINELNHLQQQFNSYKENYEKELAENKEQILALKESELKYRSLIECSSDAIFCVDEKGQYKFTNHLFATTFGQTPDYFIGKTFWDIYPKEHADQRFETTNRVFQTGKSESIEVEVPLPDKTLYFWATANPIKDETGKVILVLTHATNITERKHSEQVLKDTLSELNKSQRIAKVGNWRLDLTSNIFTSSNEGLRLFGFPYDSQPTFQEISECIHPNDREKASMAIKNALQTGEKYEIEFRIFKKDTCELRHILSIAEILLNKNCERIALVGINQDITERKKIEEKIKESEERYKRITVGLTDYLYLVKVKDGKAVETIHSDACLTVTGYSPDDFLSDPYLWINMVVPEDREWVAGRFLKILEGEYYPPCEHRIKCKNGEIRWISDTAIPKYDSNGKLVSYDGVIKNITERKQAEMEVKLIYEELLKLNADKDRFISILGHDLKSPLSGIVGTLDLLTENIRNYEIEKTEEFLKYINESAKNIFKLLEDILLWARAQSGKFPFEPQKLNFTQSCKSVVENLILNADTKNITIQLPKEEELTVFADNDMLKTILRNLISNAIKFTNNGGLITINAFINQSETIISIADNGIGIPPEIKNKLFDISHKITTPGTANESGTGIGLLLCKEFVLKHGGNIWVESEVGKGSEFKFTLKNI